METGGCLAKVLIIGDVSVGKSCIVSRFMDLEFEEIYYPTLLNDFFKKTAYIDNEITNFQIWELAGNNRYIERK